MIQKYYKVTQTKKRERKERVLHTRISENLDEELREKAAGLGVSVSNLVRNILLNTVEMVEDIVADSSSIARAAGPRDRRDPADPEAASSDQVVGWQELSLNINALCQACNCILPKGSAAAIAVVPGGQSKPEFRCLDCIATIAPEADEE